MANNVFANGMELACKSGSGKTICAFPDVCFTPPENPATPPGVPIPYPNTGMDSDTTDGSKKVKISDKEVMLKNKSCFKKSMGDEAGAAAKKGVITSKNRGKVYFNAWSMDVKIEGENVDRHLDLTTNNHASMPGDTPPWLFQSKAAKARNEEDECKEVREEIAKECSDGKEFKAAGPPPQGDCSRECCDAKKCALAPYGSGMKCCDGKTKHHIVPDHCFKSRGSGDYFEGVKEMSYGRGLGICVTGEDKDDSDENGDLLDHGKIHRDFDRIEDEYRDSNNQEWLFGEAATVGADVCGFYTGCDKGCLKQQTENYYKDKGVHNKTTLRANSNASQSSAPPVDRSAMGNNRVIWSG